MVGNCAARFLELRDLAKVDAKPTAKTGGSRARKRPRIERNEIEFEGSGDAETAIILTERDAIGNSGENKAHQRPPKEKDCQSGPLRFELLLIRYHVRVYQIGVDLAFL